MCSTTCRTSISSGPIPSSSPSTRRSPLARGSSTIGRLFSHCSFRPHPADAARVFSAAAHRRGLFVFLTSGQVRGTTACRCGAFFLGRKRHRFVHNPSQNKHHPADTPWTGGTDMDHLLAWQNLVFYIPLAVGLILVFGSA